MTDQRRRLRATARRPLPTDERGGAGAPRVLPLGGVRSLAVSADAVRAKLGAWVGLCAPEERPDLDTAWREVLLVLGAVVESGSAGLGGEALPPWERDVAVPREPLDLRRRTALPRDGVRRAIDRAISAELLDLVSRLGDGLVVRIRPEVFADDPIVAGIDWDAVRGALGAATTPVALLLVREIARRTAPERRLKQEAVSISLRELGAATGASKGTIQKTLGTLHAAGLAESWARDRVDSWHRLLPTVFGGVTSQAPSVAIEAGRAPHPAPLTSPSGGGAAPANALPVPATMRVDVGAGRALQPHVATSSEIASPPEGARMGIRPSVAAAAISAVSPAVTVYEVNGVRWPLPAGVRPQLERGTDGPPVRRIGNLRLPTQLAAGPAAPVWFEIDGVAWQLPLGAQPELERDADGSYWFRIDGERWPFMPHVVPEA